MGKSTYSEDFKRVAVHQIVVRGGVTLTRANCSKWDVQLGSADENDLDQLQTPPLSI